MADSKKKAQTKDTDPQAIVYYLDRAQIPDTGEGGYYGVQGVPLADITQEVWDSLPEYTQATVESIGIYVADKPAGWKSQADIDQQAYDEWAQAHPEEAQAQQAADEQVAQREAQAAAGADDGDDSSQASTDTPVAQ